MRRDIAILMFPLVALLATTPVEADVTGTIDATITLAAACSINGQSINDGASSVNFGTINFGTQSTAFTSADGEATSTGTGIALQCSPSISPAISFGAGQHDAQATGSGNHAMANTSVAGQYVSYGLYQDVGRNTLIPINGSMTLASDGSAQTIHVYGRAYGASGLAAGAYTDTVLVTLTF